MSPEEERVHLRRLLLNLDCAVVVRFGSGVMPVSEFRTEFRTGLALVRFFRWVAGHGAALRQEML